jgi:hypothetical protein
MEGPRLPAGSMPVASSLSPPPSPSSYPSQPGPSEDRFPSPSVSSVIPDATGPTGHQPTLPQSAGVDPETHSLLNPEPFRIGILGKVLKGKLKRRISSSDAVNLAWKDTRSRNF